MPDLNPGTETGTLDAGQQQIAQVGTFANRPNFGVAGRFYYASDAGVLYEDTGAAWQQVINQGDAGWLASDYGLKAANFDPMGQQNSVIMVSTSEYALKVPVRQTFTAGTLWLQIQTAGSVLTAAAATTVAVGSNGQNLNNLTGGNLQCAATTNFAASGVIVVQNSGAQALVSYTSLGAGPNFGGCTVLGTVSGTVSTGGTITQSFNQMGIYNSAGVCQGLTGDLVAAWQAGTQNAALTVVNGGSLVFNPGYCYVVLMSTGTTPPVLGRAITAVTTFNWQGSGATLRAGRIATGATSLTSSFTPSALPATTAIGYWVGIS